MNRRTLFVDGWEFTKQPLGSELKDLKREDVLWEEVTLPHDWLIRQVKDLYENSTGWYRRPFTYFPEGHKRTALYFEGVYMDSTLYVNGCRAGEWKYGYSSFEIDITDHLKEGENEIVMKVVHQSPNSRWYSGAGIYRKVYLVRYPETHFISDGIYLSAREEGKNFLLSMEAEVKRGTGDQGQLQIRHQLIDYEGKPIKEVYSGWKEEALIQVENPCRWELERPVLYYVRSELIRDREVIDHMVTRFGFRSVEFTEDRGFFLNGKHVKMNGVCEHHDLGCLGAAVNKAAVRRKLSLLKEMGVNAVRTAHNMPAVELLDLADEMGILIVDEAFDMWERQKTAYDYARFFPEWWRKDVASWIRRDRNHPCVVLWSIGNEIYDTHADSRGAELTRMLTEEVMKYDPAGNGKVTIGSNYMAWENARKCAEIVKIAGYNYSERLYRDHHESHPDYIIYGSETSSVVQSRGIYHFPYEKSLLVDDDEQCSSLGNSTTSWGAKSAEYCIKAERDCPFSLGQFLWTGFDYIGEPTPYHTKNSYFGQIDTAGFPKDSFYQYQGEWTDYKSRPMIHIFPYWDFNEGQQVTVRVCSNAPEVELFLDGESLGRRRIDHKHGEILSADYSLVYRKGVLRGKAYDETGLVIASALRSSFSDAARIVLIPDKTEMGYCCNDLVFLTIQAEDKDGNPVENANNRIHVSVQGSGWLAGLDNGDSTDYDEYAGTSKRLFSGKLLAVIASDNSVNPEDIRVTVSSEGMEDEVITIKALSSLKPPELYDRMKAEGEYEGYGPLERIKTWKKDTSPKQPDIPIRKIEIHSEEGYVFTPDRREMTVSAVTLPENAGNYPLLWRVTDEGGVDSVAASILEISHDGRTMRFGMSGDGTCYVRCMTGNGEDKPRLISMLGFRGEGLGSSMLNPYDFLSASLYDSYTGEVTNGNERGIATGRTGMTSVTFTGLDFGDYGADEVAIPIFELGSEEAPITFWEGVPFEEGSEIIGRHVYHKKSRWNVYQEETFKLDRRLTGVTSFGLSVNQKIHVKGFQFKRIDKAFEKLPAVLNTVIYGDSYKIREDGEGNKYIQGIGNNVSLVFEGMDFGEDGTLGLTICGHTPLDVNTIHLRFESEEGMDSQIVEFFHSSSGPEERTFRLRPVKGKQKVTFVFLPGCDFDFLWFQFKRQGK